MDPPGHRGDEERNIVVQIVQRTQIYSLLNKEQYLWSIDQIIMYVIKIYTSLHLKMMNVDVKLRKICKNVYSFGTFKKDDYNL